MKLSFITPHNNERLHTGIGGLPPSQLQDAA